MADEKKDNKKSTDQVKVKLISNKCRAFKHSYVENKVVTVDAAVAKKMIDAKAAEKA